MPLETNIGRLASSPPVADAAANAGPAAAFDSVDANFATSSAASQYGRAMPALLTAKRAARRSLFGPVDVIGVVPLSMMSTNAVSTAAATTPCSSREKHA